MAAVVDGKGTGNLRQGFEHRNREISHSYLKLASPADTFERHPVFTVVNVRESEACC